MGLRTKAIVETVGGTNALTSSITMKENITGSELGS